MIERSGSICWVDVCGTACIMRPSSMQSDGTCCIWLGVTGTGVFDSVAVGYQMLLGRKDVVSLIEYLQRWLDTGSLFPSDSEPSVFVSDSTASMAVGYALVPDLEEGD